MTHSGEPSQADRDVPLDRLVRRLDGAGRAANKALVRWLLDADVPLLAACVLVTLEPPDSPMSVGQVAEAIGVSNDEAARALHQLRSLGYAREENRRYEPTQEGLRIHTSLANARREALTAFISGLSEDERRQLAGPS
jgi:hypothetical protein